MTKETAKLEKKFEIFIENQNELARMTASNYDILKVIAKKVGIEESDFPKPLIDMAIEEETTEVK